MYPDQKKKYVKHDDLPILIVYPTFVSRVNDQSRIKLKECVRKKKKALPRTLMSLSKPDFAQISYNNNKGGL